MGLHDSHVETTMPSLCERSWGVGGGMRVFNIICSQTERLMLLTIFEQFHVPFRVPDFLACHHVFLHLYFGFLWHQNFPSGQPNPSLWLEPALIWEPHSCSSPSWLGIASLGLPNIPARLTLNVLDTDSNVLFNPWDTNGQKHQDLFASSG